MTEKRIGLVIKDGSFDIGVIGKEVSYYSISDIICFTDTEVLFEEEAEEESKDFSASHFSHYVNYIGYKEKDRKIQSIKGKTHFKISSDYKGYFQYEFSTRRYKNFKLYPEQLLSLMLSYIKLGYGQGINKITISLDVKTTQRQIELIEDAAHIAGFTDVAIIPNLIAIAALYTKEYNNAIIHHNNIFGHIKIDKKLIQLITISNEFKNYDKVSRILITTSPLSSISQEYPNKEIIQVENNEIQGVINLINMNKIGCNSVEDEISIGLPGTGPIIYAFDEYIPFVIHNELQLTVFTNEIEFCTFNIHAPRDCNMVDVKIIYILETNSIELYSSFGDQRIPLERRSKAELDLLKTINDEILADEDSEEEEKVDENTPSKLNDFMNAIDCLSCEKSKWGLSLKQKMTVSELLVKEKVDAMGAYRTKKMSQLDYTMRLTNIENSIRELTEKYTRPAGLSLE